MLTPSNSIEIREDPKEGVFVDGVTWAPVATTMQAMTELDKGNKNRATAATKMNGARAGGGGIGGKGKGLRSCGACGVVLRAWRDGCFYETRTCTATHSCSVSSPLDAQLTHRAHMLA